MRAPSHVMEEQISSSSFRLLLLLLLLCVAYGCNAPARHQPSRGPAGRGLNVLLVTADDLGPHLGIYRDPFAVTPNLDRLARSGVWFTNAYVTQASCSPSRSSILTSLYPHQNGQIGLAGHGYRITGRPATIPGLLGQAGYRTGILGKLHVEPTELFPFDVSDTDWEQMRDVRLVARKAREFMRETGEMRFFLMVCCRLRRSAGFW